MIEKFDLLTSIACLGQESS